MRLTGVRTAERARWRNGGEWDQQTTCIAVGELADGRWYARLYEVGQDDEPRPAVYAGPHAAWYARKTAGRWMRTVGGTWVEA